MLFISKSSNFSSVVVEPFTEYPSSNKEMDKGFPNQPQPKTLTLFIN